LAVVDLVGWFPGEWWRRVQDCRVIWQPGGKKLKRGRSWVRGSSGVGMVKGWG